MHNRRIYETIGLRYDDIGAMDSIVTAVRDMLVNHDDIDQQQVLMVNFVTFGPSSVDFSFIRSPRLLIGRPIIGSNRMCC